jgi:hypothetical protein
VPVGQAAAAGDTEWRVNRVETDPGPIDNWLTPSSGLFVLVNVTVTYTGGGTPPILTMDDAVFVTADGSRYDQSGVGIMFEDSLFLEQLQAGVPITGWLIYDVPPGSIAGATLSATDASYTGHSTVTLDLGL